MSDDTRPTTAAEKDAEAQRFDRMLERFTSQYKIALRKMGEN